MPRVPVSSDVQLTQLRPAAAPQIDIGVAANIGKAGKAWGNAIEALGAGFSELTGRFQTANDEMADANARLEFMKRGDEMMRDVASTTTPDGAGYDSVPSRLTQITGDIDKQYPISDPKRRRHFEAWRDDYAYRAYGRKALETRQSMGVAELDKRLYGNVEGLAAGVESGQYDDAQFQERAKTLRAMVDGLGPTGSTPGIRYSATDLAERKRQIDARLTGAIFNRVGHDKPEEVIKFWGDARNAEYELDTPKPGDKPAGAPQPGTQLQQPQGGAYGLGRQGSAVERPQGQGVFPVPSVDPASVPRSGGAPNSREHMGPRSGGSHAGWDIPGQVGAPVVAVDNGTVLRVGSGQGYGSYVDVQYSDGTIHRLAHLGDADKGGKVQPFAAGLKPGMQVKAGDELGYLGYSGNAGREFPHVHYEVFKGQQEYDRAQGQSSRASASLRINPRQYFEGRSSAGQGASDIGAPRGTPPATIAAVKSVAGEIGADPRAIAGVFTMESEGWRGARTGSYRGVSQVGPDTLAEMGVSTDAYDKMSQAEQAAFYGKWLKHYKFDEKMQAAGIDFKAQPPARQAAILQAFQFAPNGSWIGRLGQGDDKSPVTDTKQARPLGSTSIVDMERHFSGQMPATADADQQGGQPVPMAQRGLTTYAGNQAQRGQITAERYTPEPNESGFPRADDRERFVLKGTPEQKAQQLREIVSAGYGDVVHSLASKSGDDVVAVKQGAPNWQTNGVAKDDAPDKIRNRLSDAEFVGPGWAKDVVAEMKAGKVLAPQSVASDQQPAGRSLGDYLRERIKDARAEPDRPLSEVLPPDAIEELKPYIGPNAQVDKITVGDALGAIESMRNKDGRVDVADANGMIPQAIRERMATADPNAKLSDVLGDLPEGQRLRETFPDLFDDPDATVQDARDFAATMGIDDRGAGQQGVFNPDIMRPGYKGRMATGEVPIGRMKPGQTFNVGGYTITSEMFNAFASDKKQMAAMERAALDRMRQIQEGRENVAKHDMAKAEAMVEQTGELPPGYDPKAIAAITSRHPKVFMEHKARMDAAATMHETFKDAGETSIDGMRIKVERMYPDASDDYYDVKLKAFDKATKRLADIEAMRMPGTARYDGVNAVDPEISKRRLYGYGPSSLVENVRRGFQNYDRPSNAEERSALLDARMKAQIYIGIPEASARPLLDSEARDDGGFLNGIGAGDLYEQLPKVVAEAKKKYGEMYAGAAVRQMMDVAIKDRRMRSDALQQFAGWAEQANEPINMEQIEAKEYKRTHPEPPKAEKPPERSIWQKMGDYVPSLPGPDVGKNVGVELYPPMAAKRSTPPAAAIDALVFKDKAAPYEVEKFRRTFGLQQGEVDAMIRKRLQPQ